MKQIKQKMKNNKKLVAIIFPLLLIIMITTSKIILNKELIIDKKAYDLLVVKLRNPVLNSVMKIITKLSNTGFIAIMSIILIVAFYYANQKKISILIAKNLAFVALLNQIIKFTIQRQRPIGYRMIEMGGYSFPSGHAMISVAFYGILIYIINHLVKNKVLKSLLILLNILIIILIGISRVYLGVHYLSDVITGYSISLIYLLILTKKLKKIDLFP